MQSSRTGRRQDGLRDAPPGAPRAPRAAKGVDEHQQRARALRRLPQRVVDARGPLHRHLRALPRRASCQPACRLRPL